MKNVRFWKQIPLFILTDFNFLGIKIDHLESKRKRNVSFLQQTSVFDGAFKRRRQIFSSRLFQMWILRYRVETRWIETRCVYINLIWVENLLTRCSTFPSGNYNFDRDGKYGSRFYCSQHFGFPGVYRKKNRIYENKKEEQSEIAKDSEQLPRTSSSVSYYLRNTKQSRKEHKKRNFFCTFLFIERDKMLRTDVW